MPIKSLTEQVVLRNGDFYKSWLYRSLIIGCFMGMRVFNKQGLVIRAGLGESFPLGSSYVSC